MIFSKFFNKIKNYKEKINEFESAVSMERMSFSQIMEKNAALELEIAQRMEELQQANKSILTLQNIWSTMNSSDPLNEVLKTIAIFRFVMPAQVLRCAAGRKKLGNNGIDAFNAGANALISGDFLTVSGSTNEEDIQMLKSLGYTIG